MAYLADQKSFHGNETIAIKILVDFYKADFWKWTSGYLSKIKMSYWGEIRSFLNW